MHTLLQRNALGSSFYYNFIPDKYLCRPLCICLILSVIKRKCYEVIKSGLLHNVVPML